MNRRIAVFLSCLLLATGAAAAEDNPYHESIRIGGDVEVSEATSGSLNAVGGRISVEAPVAGNLRAAGGHIEVGPAASIEGDTALAGGSIRVKGPVHGDLHAAGGQVTIDAPVTGDAHVAAGSLRLGPGARIGGKLEFRGGELQQDTAAQVTGGIEHIRRNWHRHESTPAERFTRGWAWTIGLVVLAALFAGALPGPSQRLALELRERPWLSALLGFLAVTAIPIAALLVMITIIGIPIGLLALAFYAALLVLGYIWLAVVVGGLVLEQFNAQTAALTAWRVGAAMLAMLAIAILVRVPYVGGVLKFAALIVGVGMIVGALMRHRQPAAPTPAS